MNRERHKRQSGIITPDQCEIPIHIIGCGGIGSWSALLLAKMGCPDITIYDFDDVEEHNVASQFYKQFQTGLKKTVALKENVHEQTGVELKIGDPKKEEDIRSSIIVIAVDSMKRRSELSKAYYETTYDLGGVNVIIDARMGGLQGEIYCVPSDIYHETIVSEDDIQREACTERSISFNCAMIGSLVANAVRIAQKDVNELYSQYKERTFLFEGVSVLNPDYRRD